ncbi:hypothetical protein [Mucilaginibacter sp.]|uniref:hypothetical protein n=1 Tax=Mucilaginibacter sp. TaxID=1882438 RepID=UPI0026160867|nr:hypothetical protein [Mucilaginibacter sp.]MDB5032228.1 hypothetical protein [Mucilaginibacter sp.]
MAKRKQRVTVKWSKKENDWQSRFPEWENRNAKILGNAFFTMISEYEAFRKNNWLGEPTGFKDLRTYLDEAGFDPDSFTISVYAKPQIKP